MHAAADGVVHEPVPRRPGDPRRGSTSVDGAVVLGDVPAGRGHP